MLSLENVSVIRLTETIVENVSFTLSPREAAMLEGANGSGKTSLLRAIAGFSRSTGTIDLITSGEHQEDRMHAIHFIGHDNSLNRRLGSGDHIRFWGDLLGSGITKPTAQNILARLDLPDAPVWKLSAGQCQRLSLARVLAAPRPVWLLDEPVTALDAAGRALLAELCREHRDEGGIVVASTHGLMDLPGSVTLALQSPAMAEPPQTRAGEIH